jgi:hypothetical protein
MDSAMLRQKLLHLFAAVDGPTVPLPYPTPMSCHAKEPSEKVHADNGYCGEPN